MKRPALLLAVPVVLLQITPGQSQTLNEDLYQYKWCDGYNPKMSANCAGCPDDDAIKWPCTGPCGITHDTSGCNANSWLFTKHGTNSHTYTCDISDGVPTSHHYTSTDCTGTVVISESKATCWREGSGGGGTLDPDECGVKCVHGSFVYGACVCSKGYAGAACERKSAGHIKLGSGGSIKIGSGTVNFKPTTEL